ncbi:uncharacterized protein [Nicotiana tomentosiformis]|uniref:uncharacterized protein n=1 Tax=Nicotiana tomentosiformis TaxID=4098 RepID=UPI00388C533A
MGAAFRWWEAYEQCRPAGAAPLLWHEFSVLFVEKFMLPTHMEKLCRQFEQLFQEGARFDEVVDIARQRGGLSGVSSRGQFYHSRGHPYRTAQVARPVHHGASSSHGSYSAHSGQPSFSALPAQSSFHDSSSQASTSSSSGYQEHQLRQRRGCFECGDLSHLKRDCLRLLSGVPQQEFSIDSTSTSIHTTYSASSGWGSGSYRSP